MVSKTTNIKGMATEELVEEYLRIAKFFGECNDTGEYEKPNRLYPEFVKIYQEIRKRGREGQLLHIKLLEHQDLTVRVWAAAHALEYATDRAVATLQEIAKNRIGIERLNAEMTLREWEAGRLKLE